ncbi:hypothetical protein CG723_45245 [Streptomyces sp. CB01635]|uniref:hypothetical protein n=1 Tax=unclassified Streptomyces TaxID=2593676 RepID=UPI000C27E69E|nr:hypothetical protein [Streptomyces sp. CB01635]PJN05376.1 hypothetical protein CG723_45245 [Streptomyces sp. CB01635]
MPKQHEDEVLRRTSFKVLSCVSTVAFGLVAVGLLVSLTHDLEGGPTSGVAACLFTIALVRRLLGSRIVLDSSAVEIVNPLVTYRVPYSSVAEIRGGGGGTLNLVTRAGDEIYSTGFGGSLIDNFVGSTGRAAERIEQRVRRGRRVTQQGSVTKKFTVSWIADFCTAGAIICAVTAGVLGV